MRMLCRDKTARVRSRRIVCVLGISAGMADVICSGKMPQTVFAKRRSAALRQYKTVTRKQLIAYAECAAYIRATAIGRAATKSIHPLLLWTPKVGQNFRSAFQFTRGYLFFPIFTGCAQVRPRIGGLIFLTQAPSGQNTHVCARPRPRARLRV